MKRIWILALFVATIMCSCASDGSVTLVQGSDSFGIVAEDYSGTQSTQLPASENTEITVNVSAHVKSGTASYKCTDSAGNLVGESEFSSNAAYSFKLTGPEEYSITITGSHFSGDLTFDWDIIGPTPDESSTDVVVINPNAFG